MIIVGFWESNNACISNCLPPPKLGSNFVCCVSSNIMHLSEDAVKKFVTPRNKLHSWLIVISICAVSLVGAGCDKPTVVEKNPSRNQSQAVAKSDGSSTAAVPTAKNTQAGDSILPEFKYQILHWNVESGGSDPPTVAAQLVELGQYDVIGLSEVDEPEAFEQSITEKWPERYQYVRGLTGVNEDREDDHLFMAFDTEKFELVNSVEMKEVEGFVFDDGHHRAPLYVRLKDKANGQEVVFIMNHLARGDENIRQAQARALREWARNKSIPIVAIGDYNLDYVFETQKGNEAFGEFMKDNVWTWVRPEPLIDTNWSDRDGDGIDNYIDSLLDFSFVSGAAKTWKASSRVIVRENDFPDDEKTSDHRPVELILTNN